MSLESHFCQLFYGKTTTAFIDKLLGLHTHFSRVPALLLQSHQLLRVSRITGRWLCHSLNRELRVSERASEVSTPCCDVTREDYPPPANRKDFWTSWVAAQTDRCMTSDIAREFWKVRFRLAFATLWCHTQIGLRSSSWSRKLASAQSSK